MEIVNVTVNRKPGLEVEVGFEVPTAEVEAQVKRAAQAVAANVQIPGFRKGKAPLKTVEENFAGRILAIAEDSLLEAAPSHALEKAGFKFEEIIGAPRLRHLKELERNAAFPMELAFSLAPAFELQPYEGIKLKRKPASASDEDVKKELDRLAESHALYLAVDRKAQAGDLVVINCKAFDEAKTAITAFTMDGMSFVAGQTFLPKSFQDEVLATGQGETRSFSVTFPEGYQVKELAGKRSDFTVEVVSVKERRLPDIDDEFAKNLGLETAAELKERVKEGIESRKRQEAESQLMLDLLEELRKRNPMAELPERFLESERESRRARLKETLRMMNIDEERYYNESGRTRADVENSIEEESRKHVHSAMILRAIAAKEKISVTNEELTMVIASHAQRNGKSVEGMIKKLRDDGQIPAIKSEIHEQKILHFLLKKAEIEESEAAPTA